MRPYQEMSPEKYIQVIAHELGHHLDLSLNPNQPDPKFGSDNKPINDNEERIYNHAEIRAKTFAIRLLQENGVPPREDYLKDNNYTLLSTSVQIKANEDYASHMLAVANMYVGLENPAEYTIDQISNLIHMAQQSISPLVLDLNGDGVKTTSIENGTYFDLDANGHAEKTAYIDPNDAFLVRDLNKNGQIDSGHELFGNHTLLSNGKKAANGFEALADLDSNKNGIFDAKDTAYHELFLFRDKNGNGIVDKGELISLKAAGIKSLNIAYKNSTEVDENGNKHAQQGSFTKSDGTTGKVNDVWFNANLANTKDTLNFKVTDEVKSLINIKGFGNVHDLHNAIMQDTTGRLKELVISITEGINKKQTLSSLSDQVTNLIFEWAGAAKYTSQSRGSLIDARMLYTLEAFMGQGFKQDEVGKDPLEGAGKLLKKSFQILKDYVFDQFIFTTKLAPLFNQLSYTWNAKTQKMDPNINKLLSTLKSEFSANTSDFNYLLRAFRNGLMQKGEIGKNIINQLSNAGSTQKNSFEERIFFISYDVDQIHSGTVKNDQLIDNAGSDLYIISKGHGQDTIYNKNNAKFDAFDIIKFNQINFAEATFRREGSHLIISGYYGSDQVTINEFFIDKYYTIDQFEFADKTITFHEMWEKGFSYVSDDLVIDGWGGWNNIQGGNKNHTINTYSGNDVIKTGSGNNTVNSGAGNDTITLGSGNNTVNSGAGNDTIYSGTGNDYLRGSDGADTYIFSKGHGQDIVSDYGDATSTNIDTIKFTNVKSTEVKYTRQNNNLILSGYNGTNQVTINEFFSISYNKIEKFTFSDKTITFEDLWISGITVNSDELTITGWNGKDFIQGGNKNHTINAGAGDNVIKTGSGDNIVNSGSGNDMITLGSGNNTVSSGAGNDTITLGSGNNTVNSGTGNDTIYSGTGNDYLRGSDGADTYIFSKGHGQDIVSDYGDATSTNIDTIKFTNVKSTEVKYLRQADNLVIYGYNGTNQVTINDFFSNIYNKIEQIVFEDKIITNAEMWNTGLSFYSDNITINGWGNGVNSIQGGNKNHTINTYNGNDIIQTGSGNNIVNSGSGNDMITLGSGNNTVSSGAGNDTITLGSGNNTVNSGAGNDTIYSGTGNDYLRGSDGADTYIFSKGHGQDIVSDYGDATSTNIDTIKFTNVKSTEVKYTRQNNNLILSGYNGTNQVTINEFFSISYNKIEKFTFSDKTITFEDLWISGITVNSDELTITGWNGKDFIQGGNKNHTINAGAGDNVIKTGSGDNIVNSGSGNDMITLGSGNNTVSSGAGNDTITLGSGNNTVNSGAGNDTIYSGTGNDYLRGSDGADTYIFSKGHGQDIVSDYGDATSTNIDTIKFTNVKSTEVKYTRQADNLVIYGYNGTNQVTINEFFSISYNMIEKIVFEDKIITNAEMWNTGLSFYSDNITINGWGNGVNNIQGGNKNHTINTYNGNDIIQTGSGNNIVNSNAGNDTIKLGAGNNTVNSGAGNDTIYSGTGNDYLRGSDGADTYIFSKGHGQDIVSDYGDATSTNIDTIKFTNVKSTEVKYTRQNNNLILSGYNGTNQVTINEFFSISYNKIEKFTFSDKTITFEDLWISGITVNSDELTITGWNGKDFIQGGNKNHTINAGAGDNVIKTGSGDATSTNIDTIKFTNVKSTEVKYLRQADNLVIYGYNSTNQVTINDFFSNIYNKIESIEFSDSKLSYAELVKKNIEIYQNTTVSKSLAIPHEISINQEIQYLVSAMASFGKTEACIQIEEQHYSYLTPITLPN